jgi:hypothetical protein
MGAWLSMTPKWTLWFKPTFTGQVLVTPNSQLRRASGVTGQPDDEALRQAVQSHLKDGGKKSSISDLVGLWACGQNLHPRTPILVMALSPENDWREVSSVLVIPRFYAY